MMMASCKDMGADCDFVAKGETAYDVKMKMMEHAKMDHKDMMAKMESMSDDEKKKNWEMMLKNMKCA
ncbi:MAG: DUF1059 domain-containing protein [Parcubacteria group bacterium]|jgi:predicted small metal-binding protein